MQLDPQLRRRTAETKGAEDARPASNPTSRATPFTSLEGGGGPMPLPEKLANIRTDPFSNGVSYLINKSANAHKSFVASTLPHVVLCTCPSFTPKTYRVLIVHESVQPS